MSLERESDNEDGVSDLKGDGVDLSMTSAGIINISIIE